MALAARRHRQIEAWPGYVDVLSTLLMVIVFVLLVFVVAQMFLGQVLSGKEAALSRLTRQVSELGDMLALERKKSGDLEREIASLASELTSAKGDRDTLADQLNALAAKSAADQERLAKLATDIAALESLRDELQKKVLAGAEENRKISDEAQAEIALLNSQMLALRQQLAEIVAALDASETKSREQGARIVELGNRLNAALAAKVEELARYRSEFFGRLREVLGERSDIAIVGDRFVLQSEVLFDSGSAELGEAGKKKLDALAATLIALAREIPADIDWVLRVDGHTDERPIATPQFPSNWELSTARATSVAKYLIAKGLPPERLVTAGFAEFHPLDSAKTEEAYRRNRRIEFKLDRR